MELEAPSAPLSQRCYYRGNPTIVSSSTFSMAVEEPTFG